MAKINPEQAVREGYGPVAIALHWAVFLLVVAVGWLGLLHDDWPRATQAFWINIHALLGLLMFALVLTRIAWRRTHTPPDLPPDVGEFSRRRSHPAARRWRTSDETRWPDRTHSESSASA